MYYKYKLLNFCSDGSSFHGTNASNKFLNLKIFNLSYKFTEESSEIKNDGSQNKHLNNFKNMISRSKRHTKYTNAS